MFRVYINVNMITGQEPTTIESGLTIFGLKCMRAKTRLRNGQHNIITRPAMNCRTSGIIH